MRDASARLRSIIAGWISSVADYSTSKDADRLIFHFIRWHCGSRIGIRIANAIPVGSVIRLFGKRREKPSEQAALWCIYCFHCLVFRHQERAVIRIVIGITLWRIHVMRRRRQGSVVQGRLIQVLDRGDRPAPAGAGRLTLPNPALIGGAGNAGAQ